MDNELQFGRLSTNTELLHAATDVTDEHVVFKAAANFLDALYAATRQLRDRDRAAYDKHCRDTPAGRTVAGLTWLRGQHVHHAVELNENTDRYSDYYYSHFGRWEWLAGVPGNDEETFAAYVSDVAGREILPTLSLVTEFIGSLRDQT